MTEVPYTDPVFPPFPFNVKVVVSTTLRSYHNAAIGQNLGQVPAGVIAKAVEKDGRGEHDLWLKIKDAPTNDFPGGRDGWVLAKYTEVVDAPVTTGGSTGGTVTPPPTGTDTTAAEARLSTAFVELMRAVKAYLS